MIAITNTLVRLVVEMSAMSAEDSVGNTSIDVCNAVCWFAMDVNLTDCIDQFDDE